MKLDEAKHILDKHGIMYEKAQRLDETSTHTSPWDVYESAIWDAMTKLIEQCDKDNEYAIKQEPGKAKQNNAVNEKMKQFYTNLREVLCTEKIEDWLFDKATESGDFESEFNAMWRAYHGRG